MYRDEYMIKNYSKSTRADIEINYEIEDIY